VFGRLVLGVPFDLILEGGPDMVREEARRTLLREHDKWAKDHADDATKRGGVVFFTYLQKERTDFHAYFANAWSRSPERGAAAPVAYRA
jgi:hypothetical protein